MKWGERSDWQNNRDEKVHWPKGWADILSLGHFVYIALVCWRWKYPRALSQSDGTDGPANGLLETVRTRQPVTTVGKAGNILSMVCLGPKL